MTQFLTVAEVAEIFRVDPVTVRRWIRSEQLPATRIGRDWRIPGTAVEALIEGEAVS